uniref:Ig-like domain-containing protein n=1 Tax=Tetraodon nigroviridis TaxID=99883 RepID=H3CQ80_TETNG
IAAGTGLISVLLAPAVGERSSSREVVGYVGQNVTLSCTYDTKDGQLPACWGRGSVPVSGCSQQLISSDGGGIKEGSRVSSRYQLLGRLDEGDVSLTILDITADDAGTYGCRVEIVGWFNDEKHQINLVVKEG